MNKVTLLVFSLCTIMCMAQPPAGYYDTAQGLSGFELKSELKEIINAGTTVRTYGELLDLYRTSDNDEHYDEDQENTVLDIYSENPDGEDPYTYTFEDGGASASAAGEGTNREHL